MIVYDQEDWDKIIAVLDFVDFKDMHKSEKDDINFLICFLEGCKKFLMPVQSKGWSWGGVMWAIGWRKCMKELEIVGKYINQQAVNKNPDTYKKLMEGSAKAGEVLGKLFKQMGNVAVEKNQEIMKENNIPSFADSD